MLERLSVPRRSLDFEDYVDMLRRNVAWIIGPAFAGLVIATVVAYVLQDTYVSTAMIRIVPQQISDTLVQTATTQQIADHINAMAESILSRNTLTNMINTFHLYPKDLKTEPLEDVINKMKSSVTIRPMVGVADLGNTQRSLPAMQISFKYRDRLMAQKVCDEFVSRFMSQSTRESSEHTEAANQFLVDETDRAKRELDQLDQKLADFRTRNAGRLPEEMQVNLQELNTLANQENSLSAALNQNSERKMLLETSLRGAKDRLAAVKDVTPQSQARNQRVDELNREIADLQTNIENMKDRYTDDFPDLVAARQQLGVLEHQRDQALKDKPKEGPSVENPVVTRERLDAQQAIDTITAQLKANDMEAAQIRREQTELETQMRGYETRVQGIPAGEKEYIELVHDRDMAKQHYDDLEIKRERAALSSDLESRKQGESLEVLESASLPDSPAAPKRPMIIAVGPALGLLVGLIIVAVREVKDTSLKNLKDARLYTQLNILGSIPLLENDLLVQRRKQIAWVGWAAATLTGLAVIGVTVAHYYLTRA